jgi:hypothetical protein
VNRRLNLRVLDYFVGKPIRLWWLLLPLMGFDSVVSEHPLTPANEGFIDRTVTGDWVIASDGQNQVALSITRTETGLLEVRTYVHDEAGTPYLRYRGYSSRLGDNTYANLELVGYGCNDCDGAELTALRTEIFDPLSPILASRAGSSCTFILVRYELTADNRLIVFRYGDDDLVKLAIQQRQLAGRLFGTNAGDLAGEPCITDTAAKVREFYAEHAAALFPTAQAETFVHPSRATAAR